MTQCLRSSGALRKADALHKRAILAVRRIGSAFDTGTVMLVLALLVVLTTIVAGDRNPETKFTTATRPA